MFIPDPRSEFFHPWSRIRIKEFKYYNLKKWFLSTSEIWFGFFIPWSRSRIRCRIFIHPGSQGSKKGTGSRIQIRNTAVWFSIFIFIKLKNAAGELAPVFTCYHFVNLSLEEGVRGNGNVQKVTIPSVPYDCVRLRFRGVVYGGNIACLAVLRIRIRDPGSGIGYLFWPLDSGSGIRDGRKSASGSGIQDPGWTTRIIFFRA